jgi:tetratricopeptide (TPR) repeat protein
MAFILIEQEKYQEAILRLEDILARAPSSDKVRFYLGAVYEEIKDYKSAISHFEKVPAVSTYYHEAVIHASYLFKLKGDYEKAIATIETGIKTRDDHAPFYALYASLLDDQKRYRDAEGMLKGAIEKFPENAQLRFYLGSMQDKLGDKESTIASMKAVLQIDKNHVQALNYLAYTYADRNWNLDEAERLVRHALEIQPNDGFVMDTLGWILFKKGKANEAIRMLEAAYKIQPNESVIAEHLGDAYYHIQMPDKAKKLYQRAAESETNVATVEKIRAKIVDVDRQIQNFGSDGGRQPASAKSP